ncbi:GATA-binding factor 1-B-like [Nematolebias whitei]|uniref:GATA-binding factor 1-B-like n=1 Tax=Nematolebias whitei TaxID=451745 RepID=UPI0018978E7F|nr:GATA-binding factor 1-B-like [Nematolebias whitei]XP_037552874.1 GATA-binding factor 1-B-like [Nematolebias whitei]
MSCGSSSAPLWRRAAAGQHLCYTCSRKQEVGGNEPLLRPRRRAVPSVRKGTRCSDCETETTTLWRRNAAGQPVCNACGLYYRLHQVSRPLDLKKERLQTRNRKVTNKKGTKRRSGQSESPA